MPRFRNADGKRIRNDSGARKHCCCDDECFTYTHLGDCEYEFLYSGSGSVISWDFGDGSSGSGANPTHDFPADGGTYTVELTVDGDFVCEREITTACGTTNGCSFRCDPLPAGEALLIIPAVTVGTPFDTCHTFCSGFAAAKVLPTFSTCSWRATENTGSSCYPCGFDDGLRVISRQYRAIIVGSVTIRVELFLSYSGSTDDDGCMPTGGGVYELVISETSPAANCRGRKTIPRVNSDPPGAVCLYPSSVDIVI